MLNILKNQRPLIFNRMLFSFNIFIKICHNFSPKKMYKNEKNVKIKVFHFAAILLSGENVILHNLL